MGMIDSDIGVDVFVRRSSDPAKLKTALMGVKRLISCREGEPLCLKGDVADCMWIVDRGEFDIRDGHIIAHRGQGDLIGEGAFFRAAGNEHHRRRGADVVARVRSDAWLIEGALLASLPDDVKQLWLETVCTALVAKLDEATHRRVTLTDDVNASQELIERFVCQEGVAAARAALRSRDVRIAAVRKRALIWFSDVAGFSTHAEDLSPDEVGRVLRSLLDPQVEEITAAGGQVDKFMGDGIMAFWLCSDDATLATTVPAGTRAALSAAARVRDVVRTAGSPLGIRIGLHLGEVAIGDFGGTGRIAFTLVGEAVNTASRFEQFRPKAHLPDAPVRISQAVFDHLQAAERDQFRGAPITITDKHCRDHAAFLSAHYGARS